MRKCCAIMHKELQHLLLSPIGYVTAAVFLSSVGWTFLHTVRVQTGASVQVEALQVIAIVIWLPVLITVVTMRLFAEEKRSGTIETLLTSAVSDLAVVLGKYCGAVLYIMLVVLPALAGVYLLAYLAPGIEAVDHMALAGGACMLVLLLLCCTAIGLLISLCTRNQIVAAICCFWGILLPFMIKPFLQMLPFVRRATLEQFSVEAHVLRYTGGMLDIRLAVLYASVTVFLLFAAVRVLESRRWL